MKISDEVREEAIKVLEKILDDVDKYKVSVGGGSSFQIDKNVYTVNFTKELVKFKEE